MRSSAGKYLFLHYGPGGNSSLERLLLKSLESEIDFWDQPLAELDNLNSKALVKVCREKYESQNYKGIIAHSFGCDLALQIAEQTVNPIVQLVLISPIRNIPLGFCSFATKLTERTQDSERKKLLKQATADLSAKVSVLTGEPFLTTKTLPIFFNLIATIATDPLFYRLYWKNPEKLNFFEQNQKDIKPMDFSFWQTMLSDFFIKPPVPFKYPIKGTVLTGEHDPYFGRLEDEKKHWEKAGFQFLTVPEAAHHPHLESNILDKILKNRVG